MTKLFTLLAFCSMALTSNVYAEELTPSDATGGIGIQIQIEQDGTFSILADLPGSPAEAAGLQAGDLVEAIQASPTTALTSVAGETLAEVVEMIRGPIGTPVTLEIIRGQKEMTFSLVRAAVDSN